MAGSRARWLSACIGVVLLAGAATYLYRVDKEGKQAAKAIAEAMMQPHPVAPVKPGTWSHLRVGMTKQEVSELLGEAPSRSQGQLDLASPPGSVEALDFWEYGHASAMLAPFPDDRAHVVYFGRDGRVLKFRAPAEGPVGREPASIE
jgi:hypothetical protein